MITASCLSYELGAHDEKSSMESVMALIKWT